MSDFTWDCDNVIKRNSSFNVLEAISESGYSFRRLKSSTQNDVWELTFVNRTKTEMDAIRSFYVAKYGSLTSFTWTEPDTSTEYTVKFQGSFSPSRDVGNIYSVTLTLVRVK